MQRTLIIALSVFVLASCSLPETRIYNLYMPPPPSSPVGKGGVEGFGETVKTGDLPVALVVHSPKHLSQPYIASRNSPYQVEISRYSKWDASPDSIVRDAFRDSLSTAGLFREARISSYVPTGVYALVIDLKKFERSYASDVPYGEILFEAGFLSPDGKRLFAGTIEKKVKLDDKTFLGLAKGLSGALSEGIAEVRAGIIKALGKQ